MIHYLEALRDDLGWEELKNQVKNPLKHRRLAAYYGCMLLRPEKEMNFDNQERPQIMEDYLQALGAEVITYPFRNKCCGTYLAVTEREVLPEGEYIAIEGRIYFFPYVAQNICALELEITG